MHVLLVQISRLEVLRVLLYSTCGLSFLQGGHLENRPKWRVGSKISSVNILILIQGGPMNNVIPLPDPLVSTCNINAEYVVAGYGLISLPSTVKAILS